MALTGPTKQTSSGTLTIRRATPADAGAIIQLAALDSEPVPAGAVIVGAVGDEIWAAVSLDDFAVVADPFRPAGDLVVLLIERARSLRRAEEKEKRGRRALPRLRPAR